MSTVEYWLTRGDEKLRLPVNPEANAYESPFSYEDFEVEGLGEVTNIKRRGLREFTIESFFPATYNPVYCEYSDFPSPQECLDLLESWRDRRVPFRYIVTGAGGVNLRVTIRDISIEAEKFGEVGDIYYTLSLKEYRDVEIKTVQTGSKPNTSGAKRPLASTGTSSAQKSSTYTVKKGDSLWLIAKRFYSNGSSWRKIYDANKKVVGSNPNKIYPGQKLVIPK